MIMKDAAVLLESSQNALLRYDDEISGDLDVSQNKVLSYHTGIQVLEAQN